MSHKWYQKSLGIIALLILFFPVGLFLMWNYAKWNKRIKWGITNIFALLFTISTVSGAISNNKIASKTEPQSQIKKVAVENKQSLDKSIIQATIQKKLEIINDSTQAEPTNQPTIKIEQTQTQANEATYLVTRVIDGDTIEIEGGQRVRYIGIDTPETVDPRKSVQCYGQEASNKNKELVSGKRVRLEKDISNTDKYGRLLRYIYIGDEFINNTLVLQGYAVSSSYPPDVKYQDIFRKSQQEAIDGNRGLWGVDCKSNSTNTSQQTSLFTNTAPTQSTQTQPASGGSCSIKGNISSSGEKIYHMQGCGSYGKTVIDTGKGERWFCSEQEALQAGWRKALNC